MSTISLPTPAPPATSRPEEVHVYCDCDVNRGLCGTDISDLPFCETKEITCAVCADMEEADAPCPRCGL